MPRSEQCGASRGLLLRRAVSDGPAIEADLLPGLSVAA